MKKKVIIPDIFGWFKVSEVPVPTGGVLAYCDESDHMFICDTLVDKRTFTHWQPLPRYPFGIYDGEGKGGEPYTITWSTGYCGIHYGKE